MWCFEQVISVYASETVNLIDCVPSLVEGLKCIKKFFWTYFTKYLSSSKSEEFNIKDIEVLVGKEEQPWFKPAHIEKYLGIACIITSTTKLGKEETRKGCLEGNNYL